MSLDKIIITGGNQLHGKIKISGAKNAALPLIAASLLTDQPLVLSNVPYRLSDIGSILALLEQHGTKVSQNKDVVTLQAANINNFVAPYDIVRKMRASILVLGPLIARAGKNDVVKLSLPGGCAIGTRPVDLHIKGLKALGAEIDLVGGYIEARCPNGLTGADVDMSMISVTATENILMAACLAKGQTRIINAAREPEIIDLAKCLIAMGADISGE